MYIHKLTLAALLVAIGTLSAHLIYIPAGASKCFPVQHAINVLCAVILGPKEAVSVAFVISCLRNMAGTGSLLAFPGSMIGAFLAGLAYRRWHNTGAAMLGEIWHFRRFGSVGYCLGNIKQQGGSLVLCSAVFNQHYGRQHNCGAAHKKRHSYSSYAGFIFRQGR